MGVVTVLRCYGMVHVTMRQVVGVVTVLRCYGMVHVTEASGGCGYCIVVLWYGACD